MGIADLNKTLNNYNIYRKAALNCLRGRAVAIDASNWIYVNWSMAAKNVIYGTNLLVEDPDPNKIRKRWFYIAVKSIERFLWAGIYPIFVFDGAAPPDKGPTRIKRAKDKQAQVDKYNEMLMACRNVDVLDSGSVDMTELRKLCNLAYKLDWDEVELIQGLLGSLGLMTVKPNCEAERFCSMLCLEGLVAAVFSADTDNLAYGCPCFIKDISRDDSLGEVTEVMTFAMYADVLQLMGITHQQFVDLCIMHGCDYNSRISRVGPATIEKLIREHGSIEAVANLGKYDISCLRHERCRELFNYATTTSLNNGEPIAISFIDPNSIHPEVLLHYSEMFEASTRISGIQQGLIFVRACIEEANG